MSYGTYRRRALDAGRTVNVRGCALANAVSTYSWLTRTSFSSVIAELGRRHGFPADGRPAAQQMEAVVADLDSARTDYLAALARYAAFRRCEKRTGVRTPRPAVEAALRACVSLGLPR